MLSRIASIVLESLLLTGLVDGCSLGTLTPIWMEKVVPFLKTLSTLIEPFIDSTILLVMFRPRPVPCLLRPVLSFSLPKYLNSFLRSLALIPNPVSSIEMFNFRS